MATYFKKIFQDFFIVKKDITNNHIEKEIENNKNLIEDFKLLNEISDRMISWTLLIFGGSFLLILNPDYIKLEGRLKYSYFIFIIVWTCFSISIYKGELISRYFLSSVLIPKNSSDQFDKIGNQINDAFGKQRKFFIYGIVAFAFWMLIFLLCWVFDYKL